MSDPSAVPDPTADPSGRCRRRSGRRFQESLQSDLGVVLDLSVGGMRVLTNRAPEGVISISLFSYDGVLTVRGKVAWTRRRGFGRREIGIEFVEVDARTSRALTHISSAHRHTPPRAA